MSHTFRSTCYELSEWTSGYLYRSVRVRVVSVVIVLECLGNEVHVQAHIQVRILNLARPRERYPVSPSKLYGATA